jgi:hypothetical protein
LTGDVDETFTEYAILLETVAEPSCSQAKNPASEEAGYNNLPCIAPML